VRLLLACGVVVLAVVLAGCGGGGSKSSGGSSAGSGSSNGEPSKSANAILADVKAAVGKASAVHIHGGGKTSGSPLTIDLHLVAGRGGEGHISINGLGFDIIRIGQTLYFKGSQKFLQQYAGGAAPLLAGKWFKVSSSTSGFSVFTPLTTISAFANQVLAGNGPYSKGSETTVDGQPVIGINAASNGGTLYVATTGPAYPIEIKGGTTNTGTIKLDGWDKPEALKPPPHPVDYAKVTGSG
jgi:hypothetical protein